MENKYTKSQIKNFLKYERVRLSGFYNMITESELAMKDSKLSPKQYLFILHKYSYIKKEIESEYGSVNNALDLFEKGKL